MNRRKRRRNRNDFYLLSNLFLLLFITIFLYAAYNLLNIWQEYHAGDKTYSSLESKVAVTEAPEPETESETESETETKPSEKTAPAGLPQALVDFKALKEMNEDVIGWIQIPDTIINYPILYAEDNDKYLRTTITGESNRAGSIFVDYRVKEPFEEAATMIYGHNLLNGKMFSSLMKYEEKAWWEEHPEIYIQTESGVSLYRIFSCYRTDAGYSTYAFGMENNTLNFNNYLSMTLYSSLYETDTTPDSNSHILTLSTCTNNYEEERFVVHAVRIYPE